MHAWPSYCRRAHCPQNFHKFGEHPGNTSLAVHTLQVRVSCIADLAPEAWLAYTDTSDVLILLIHLQEIPLIMTGPLRMRPWQCRRVCELQ